MAAACGSALPGATGSPRAQKRAPTHRFMRRLLAYLARRIVAGRGGACRADCCPRLAKKRIGPPLRGVSQEPHRRLALGGSTRPLAPRAMSARLVVLILCQIGLKGRSEGRAPSRPLLERGHDPASAGWPSKGRLMKHYIAADEVVSVSIGRRPSVFGRQSVQIVVLPVDGRRGQAGIFFEALVNDSGAAVVGRVDALQSGGSTLYNSHRRRPPCIVRPAPLGGGETVEDVREAGVNDVAVVLEAHLLHHAARGVVGWQCE
jgi:hypothetical protein